MTLPYVVVRSNNLSLSTLDNLTQSTTMAESMHHRDQALGDEKAARDTLINALFDAAGAEHPQYRKLLTIKNKLTQNKVNLRWAAEQSGLLSSIDGGQAWLESYQALHHAEQQIDDQYEALCGKSRESIKSMAQSPIFRKSISFTRGNISDIVTRYCRHRGAPNKKLLNEEDTLLRYLTRAVTKVSPFSGFTSIGFSPVEASGETTIERAPQLMDKFSLDRSVFLKIYDQLVVTHSHCWRYHFSVNMSDKDNQAFCYSFRDDKQVYPFRSSLVKSRVPKFALAKDTHYDFDDLKALLGDRCEVLFNQLITTGVLQFDLRLDDQAQDILQEMKDKIAVLKTRGFDFPEFEALLDNIHQAFLVLPQQPVDRVRDCIEDITVSTGELCEMVGYQSIKQSGIVYHDTLHPSLSAIDKTLVDTFSTQVSEFLQHYIGIDYDAGVSSSLMGSLRQTMAPDQKYDLFDFYDIASSQLQQANQDPRNNVGEVNKMLRFYEHLWQHRNSDLLTLEAQPPQEKVAHSLSAYGHIHDNKFILNNVDSGYLRVWSRFFTFNDDDTVLKKCVDAYGDALEDSYDFYDTFGFNTGRRPRIAKKRIWLEPSDASQDGDLVLADLYVRWPEGEPKPRLFSHIDDKEITLRHTALFVTQLYPKLVELLLKFSMMEQQCYFAPRFGIYDMVVQQAAFTPVKLPRVMYKDVVVSRRQWWLSRQALPVKTTGETWSEYLIRLNVWREEAGIPSRVFVRRHAGDKVLQRDISNNKKPLFVDFNSPIMCRPISRVFNSSFDYISFDEMLPDGSDEFINSNENTFASEVILEKTV
ncbi:hypothetical protein CS022_21310 [Veronia nyctiphanis]|uniref:Lantibiotic dehydratase N-terminal domain-containing protein n=1 Tax=Veronia nyctiphanis TaxID=1278244 RepID=A0A4Q0YKF2_9GAMM|nr:lantibiotic dehydratase [Veronia nyctiphanis]RXJ71207.1 hypothetical protein CS022_21310 [Veronia nyctiphanis]